MGSHIKNNAAAIHAAELEPATYDRVQDYINFFGDRTLLSGGAISDAGSGVATIASLTGWCKETDSDTAVGKFFNYAGANTSALTDLTTHYIYCDYNGGTPQLVTATDKTTHGFKLDHILVGTVFNNSNTLHFHKVDNIGIGRVSRTDMHHREELTAHRASGLVTSDGGSLALSITSGVFYEGISRHASTVNGSTWSYWYTSDSGSNWTEDTSQTALVQSYNNIASGKVSLGTGKYGVHWVYSDLDGAHLHIVYGQGNYNANQAEEADVPSVLPPIVTGYGLLIAKIISHEGTTDLIITYPWTSAFKSNLATDHGSLGGIGGDDHTQYVLHSLADAANDFLVASGNDIFVKKTLAQTLTILAHTHILAAGATDVTATFGELNLLDLAALTAGELLVATGAATAAWQSTGVKLSAPDISGAVTAASALTLPTHKLNGTLDADGQAIINFANLQSLETDSADIFGQRTNAGNAFRVLTHTLADTDIARIAITGHINTAVMTLSAMTVIGLVLSGGLDAGNNAITNFSNLQSPDAIFDIFCQRTAAASAFRLLTHNVADADTARLTVSGHIDIAVASCSALVWNGMVMGSTLDVAGQYLTFLERAAPGAGAANEARMYAIVDGGSLTDMAAVFQDGSVDLFAQETTPLDAPIFTYPSKTKVKLELRKEHPGVVKMVAVFPNGKEFTLKHHEYHHPDKIAANIGTENPLPKDWLVEDSKQIATRLKAEEATRQAEIEKANTEGN